MESLARQKTGDLVPRGGGGVVAEVTDNWLEAIPNELTRKSYREGLSGFADWLGRQVVGEPFELETLPLNIGDLVSADEVRKYIRALVEQGKKRATVNHRLSVVRRWVRELDERKLIHPTRAASILNVKGLKGQNRSYRRHLSTDEAQVVIDNIGTKAVIDKRDRALIGLLFWTGLRVAELCGLKVGQYKSANGHKIIDCIQRKGGATDWVKVAVPLQRALETWLRAAGLADDPDAPLFCAVDKSGWPSRRPLCRNGVAKIIRERCEAVGLEGVTPHALRRSFATAARAGGASTSQVQTGGGWRSSKMVDLYDQGQATLDNNAVDYVHLRL